MIIKNYKEKTPVLENCFLAEDVSVIGDVTVQEDASIWYGVVLRGDVDSIVIGEKTSIQDNSVVHCASGLPTIIGKNCVVGHNAILHSCTVEDGCLIGMGATLLDGCHIGAGKSTLSKCITGENRMTKGELYIKGEKIDPGSYGIRESQRRGIAIVHQEFTLMEDMTGVENLFIGRYEKNAGIFVDWKALDRA